MRNVTIGLLALATFVAAAAPAAAQTRPRVSSSESSYRSAPTCVVNNDATACGGAGVSSASPVIITPVFVGLSPLVGPVLGSSEGGRAATDTDVDRSTRRGSAIAR